MREFRTAIEDAEGVEHLYITNAFDFDEGIALQLEIGKIMGGVAGPVVDFASSLFSMPDAEDEDDAPAVAGGVGSLGSAFTSLAQGILDAGGVALIKRVFANTTRETDLNADGTQQPIKLDSSANLGLAYTAGNNMEMYKAILWVLTVNFSPFGRDKSFSWKRLSDKLTGLVPIRSIPNTVTTTPSDGQT